MPNSNSLRELAGLLDDPRLRIVVVPERVAPSTIYDLQYRLVVIACVFVHSSEVEGDGLRQVSAPRMKLSQFVACRPWLFPVLRDWSDNRRNAQRSLLSSQRLRRGFLGDTMYDDVTSFLAARGVLARRARLSLPGRTLICCSPSMSPPLDWAYSRPNEISLLNNSRRSLSRIRCWRDGDSTDNDRNGRHF